MIIIIMEALKFKSKIEFESQTKNDHIRYLERSKEFLARLQDMSKGLVDEKEKHKQICQLAKRCPHEMACIGNCYFLDIAYVESEAEDTDQDSECDDELDDTNIESEKQTILNKCATCNFEAKNMSGLKIHEKADHRIKCETCTFKTTTKVLLKKHFVDIHNN